MIPSYFFLIGLIIFEYVSIPKAGIGYHLPVVLEEDPAKFEYWNFSIFILDWFYVPNTTLSRLSVCCLYLRIFNKTWPKIFCWIIIVGLCSFCIAMLTTALVECFPLQYAWDKTIEGGVCFDTQAWYKYSNIPNVLLDVAILFLPMETIWTLKASMMKRLGIAFVCLTGSVGLIASSVRTALFFQLLDSPEPDMTYTSSALITWTIVESGMYFSAACLVCLRPLYKKLPRWIRDRFVSLRDTTHDDSVGSMRFRAWHGRHSASPYAKLGTNMSSANDPWAAARLAGSDYDPEANRLHSMKKSVDSSDSSSGDIPFGTYGLDVGETSRESRPSVPPTAAKQF